MKDKKKLLTITGTAVIAIIFVLLAIFSPGTIGKILNGGADETREPAFTETADETDIPVIDETAAPTEKATAKATPKATSKATPKATPKPTATPKNTPSDPQVVKGKVYDDKESVALYIHLYGELPPNYITKKEAQKLGWPGGELEKYAHGKCIGGDYFGNNEGNLPKNTKYHECDIDTLGAKSRGAKRIVYGDNGSVYYTEDHYETFKKLY